MIKGYIFDYGGTLDTAGCHWGKVLWRAYQRHEVPVSEEQFREAYVHAERTLGRTPIIKPHHTFRQTLSIKIRIEMEFLCQQAYWDADEQTFNEKHEAVLADLYSEVCHTTAHSREVLTQLAGRYPMVLVSNFYGNVETVLADFDLLRYFKKIIESAVVGIRKPDPRIFSLGVEALGFEAKDILVVGDSYKKDIVPSETIGCQVAWLKGKGWTAEEDAVEHPAIIKKLAEIKERFI